MVYGATPSPAAVSGLLRIVFSGKGDEVDFNFYDLSQVIFVRHVFDLPHLSSIYFARRLQLSSCSQMSYDRCERRQVNT